LYKDNSLAENTARILLDEAHLMEPEWDDYRLKNIIRMQSMVVGYDSEAALDELSKYSFASSDFDQVTVAVRRTAERVGQIPEDVDKQVKNIANKLNIKREKF
jgi:hypothetical protein